MRVDRFARVSLDQVREHALVAFSSDPDIKLDQQVRNLPLESLIDTSGEEVSQESAEFVRDLVSGALALQARNAAKQRLRVALRSIQGWAALSQPTAEVTENRKRQAIVPAAPQLLTLKEEIQQVIETAAGPDWDWLLDPIEPSTDSLMMGTLLGPEYSIPAPGDLNELSDYFLVEAHSAVAALTRIEGIFGTFDVWARSQDLATLESVLRALESDEADSWEYFLWLMKRAHQPAQYRGQRMPELWIRAGGEALVKAKSSWRKAGQGAMGCWYKATKNTFVADIQSDFYETKYVSGARYHSRYCRRDKSKARPCNKCGMVTKVVHVPRGACAEIYCLQCCPHCVRPRAEGSEPSEEMSLELIAGHPSEVVDEERVAIAMRELQAAVERRGRRDVAQYFEALKAAILEATMAGDGKLIKTKVARDLGWTEHRFDRADEAFTELIKKTFGRNPAPRNCRRLHSSTYGHVFMDHIPVGRAGTYQHWLNADLELSGRITQLEAEAIPKGGDPTPSGLCSEFGLPDTGKGTYKSARHSGGLSVWSGGYSR